ncbi:MAG: sugar ABC transporter permease [Clostridia bacterium]|nr:sugar ABC transporter permease [Clostridia bacterium]
MSVRKARRRSHAKLKMNIQAWLIMLPCIILMVFFVWEPLFESVRMSLYETKNVELVALNDPLLKNYDKVTGRSDFGQALLNTLFYTLWSLAIGFLLPIVLALLIGEARRSKGFFRTAVYLPNMLPGLAVVILWKAFFSAEEYGVLNILLKGIGAVGQDESIHFLELEHAVIPIIIAVATWKSAGATALIYMAGLSGINSELYEAAAIDGATVLRRIFHITIPAISKLMGTLLILQIISVSQIMYEPMVLTKGGPDGASLSLMQLMWQYAFVPQGRSLQFGRAAAIAVMLTGILLVLTVIYSIVNRRQSDWD